MEKINLVELLKDCPKDMELDCTMFEDVYFDHVDELNIIHCYIQYEAHKTSITFNQHGTYNSDIKSKCVIFPKGKTTWDEFHRPFKDGDIVFYDNCVSIFKEWGDETLFRAHAYTYLGYEEYLCKEKPVFGKGIRKEVRFATEEEKQKLFQAIKNNGYNWNEETKTLEKLVELKFKDGDIAVSDKGDIHLLRTKDSSYCAYRKSWGGVSKFDKTITRCVRVERLATEEEKVLLFQEIKDNGYRWNPETKTLEELPKFKVGDKVRHKTHIRQGNAVTEIKDTHYILDDELALPFINQDEYELVSNKFDINTLVPFESRVLVRSECDNLWRPAIFGFYLDNNYAPYYAVGGTCWEQCIPYEGNEHLRGKINDCDEFFRTWEKTGN